MLPKHTRISSNEASTSSSKKFDFKKFISFEVSERFKRSLVTRSFVKESGFIKPTKFILRQISGRRWMEFSKHPEPTVASVIGELYTNILECDNKKAFVCGKWVAFDYQTIMIFMAYQGVIMKIIRG